jgi:hypothetical protein
MQGANFSGKFLKPKEAFSVQHFNYVELNRLGPEIFFGFVALAVIALLIHFMVSTLPRLRDKKGRE